MDEDALTTLDLIEKYAGYMKALNRAEKTITTHVRRVKQFFAFAEDHGVDHPAAVSKPLLVDYQKHLSEYLCDSGTTYTPAVQNQHLTVLVRFFKYLRQAGYIPHNPTLELEYARLPQRLPKGILSIKDMRKLLRQPDTKTMLGFRDRAMMEVLYSTGVRRQELIDINVEDVDVETGFIMIRQGKGKKDRVVPMGKAAARYLETYINGLRSEFLDRGPDPACKALFLSARGARISRNAVAAIIEKYVRKAGLTQRISPHTFRHTCATHMIRNRAGIRHVQEILGHAQLASTQEYINLTINDLKDAHSRFHPREKDAK